MREVQQLVSLGYGSAGSEWTLEGVAEIDDGAGTVTLEVGGKRHTLREREYSPWVGIEFRPGLGIKVLWKN